MRLSASEREAIKQVVAVFDDAAEVFLFGSRVDDAEKGGDIDLLVFSGKLEQSDATTMRLRLWEKLGEQKIDIVIVKDTSDPFTRIALKESARL